MSHGVNLLSSNDLSPLVQRLGRQADLNRDGHVSAPEFAKFLDEILHPDQSGTPGLTGDAAPFRDRLAGFGAAGPADPAAQIKARLASLVQYLAPSSVNLKQVTDALGPAAGVLGPDGMTLKLPGDQGSLGVRDLGHGPMWQFVSGS